MLGAWAIIDRDLRKYFRSPALIVVSLVLPLLQLVIIGNAFGGKITDVLVAVVDLDGGSEAERLHEKFREIDASTRTFHVRALDDVAEALRRTKSGEFAAVVVIPADYTRDVLHAGRPSLGLIVDNTDPFVVGTLTEKLRELLDAIDSPVASAFQLRRIALDVVEVYPFVEYIEYLLPGSITLAIFVCTLIGGGILYVDDKSRGFHEGYLATSISRLQLVLGMLAAGTVKATFAGLILTFLGSPIAGVVGRLDPTRVLMLILLNGLAAFALVNFVFLLMARVQDPVVPRAVFGLLNTLLFFPSGAMYPISSFPAWLRAFASINPFTYTVHGFRTLLLKDVHLSAIWGDVLFLSAFSAICFVGVLILFPRRL